MAVYVCSDIHGRYDRYCKLLEILDLSDSDMLYILGDVIDRNDNGGIDILLDVIRRDNVKLLIGNHEWFMIESLDYFKQLREHGLKYDYYSRVECWLQPCNGGSRTLQIFSQLSEREQSDIYWYLKDCPLIEVLTVNDKRYHLSHSYTVSNLEKDMYKLSDLDSREVYNIVWKSPFRHDEMHVSLRKYRKDLTYIIGHVPVQKLRDDIRVHMYHNLINIDCGCARPMGYESRLGCLCLDTMKEYYIE